MNTYSGLAKFYSQGNPDMLAKFKAFAQHEHLYDPHFYLGKNVDFLTAMFGGKNVVVTIERLRNVCKALVYSIYIVQQQIRNARDITTGLFILDPAACLMPDDDLVIDFVNDHLLYSVNRDNLPHISVRKSKTNKLNDANDATLKYVGDGWVYKDLAIMMENAKIESRTIWRNGQACKELFEKLQCGNKGYIYGAYKKRNIVITENEKKIVKCFLKKDQDMKLFLNDCEEKGFKTAFNTWGKEKKFAATLIIMTRLTPILRSKAFKRFAAKVGIDFGKLISKYAPDKRKGNGRQANTIVTTEALASDGTQVGAPES